MKQLTKEQILEQIKGLKRQHLAKTFNAADKWCKKHTENSPHIVIITNTAEIYNN